MIQKNNLKNNIFRGATIAILDRLNTNVKIKQHEESGLVEYDIPFFYDFKNDKQFVKDMFIEIPHGCNIPEHAEGNFDRSPKGVLLLEKFNVRRDEITNRFVRASKSEIEYDDNGNQVKKAYSGLMFVMPLTLSFKVTLYADSKLQMLEVVQQYLMEIYKNSISYFEFNGMRMPVAFYIGEDPNATLPTEFKWSTDDEHRTTIVGTAETYLPVFDEKSLIFKGRRIHEFYNNLYENNQKALIKDGTVDKDTVIPKGKQINGSYFGKEITDLA